MPIDPVSPVRLRQIINASGIRKKIVIHAKLGSSNSAGHNSGA